MSEQETKKILIVDDEIEMRIALEATLKREGYETVTAENGQVGLDRLGKEPFDLVLTDMRMPEMGGMDLLRSLKKHYPNVQVVMMTAYGTIDSAVESMKVGAFDYLLKPFSAEIVASTIKRAFLKGASGAIPEPIDEEIETQPEKRPPERRIVTANAKMKEKLEFVENVAYSKSTILISGESGTGKEMFARYVHHCSPRKDKPFVAVNCAALPEGLLESELFGHEKGAFTGATTRKEGKFEIANKGTLLLDEITEMGVKLQAKLLRALQEHEIDRVGGRESIPVDVRVIATTNRDIKQRIRENEFREDLFYRLNVIPMNLPSLRERKEDLAVLAEFFIEKHGKEVNKKISNIAPATLDLLKKYSWPGNVRELENTIERAVLLCRGETIQPADLFLDEEEVSTTSSPSGAEAFVGKTLHQMEKEMILQTLEEVDNNKTKCAEILGISIRTLRNKLTEYEAKSK